MKFHGLCFNSCILNIALFGFLFLNFQSHNSINFLLKLKGAIEIYDIPMSVPATLPTPAQTTTPIPGVEQFTVNFTVTNLKYREEMGQPNSTVFNTTERALIALGRFLSNSSIVFLQWEHTLQVGLHGFFPYVMAPQFDRVKVYQELINMTNGFTKMGPYTLDKDSLYVNGLPFWAIILICLSALLGFLLLFLICFLVAFCLRKKAGKYQVQQDILGLYFPHLDMRKAR
uniref:SEA domain-containing protein n=1 Tax=Podarcis muralis TaxID=64176 RepID=A0A670K312_PODMU